MFFESIQSNRNDTLQTGRTTKERIEQPMTTGNARLYPTRELRAKDLNPGLIAERVPHDTLDVPCRHVPAQSDAGGGRSVDGLFRCFGGCCFVGISSRCRYVCWYLFGTGAAVPLFSPFIAAGRSHLVDGWVAWRKGSQRLPVSLAPVDEHTIGESTANSRHDGIRGGERERKTETEIAKTR